MHSSPAPRGALSAPLIAVLGLLTAVAPLATDMYLPAFPTMAEDLGTTATGIQLTLTAFLIGLGLGQLAIGPLSDAVGRRRPLIVGSLVSLLASIACAVAPSVELLVVARFVQGLGGAAGVVLARAIVSDTSRGPAAAKLLGVLTGITVLAPVLAPLAGGLVFEASGWRAVLWVVVGLSLLMVVGVLAAVHETHPATARTTGGFAATRRAAAEVLANRDYVGYLLTFCFAFAALFAYISASPFVVQNVLGMSAAGFSLVFSANSVVILVTGGIAAALAGRVSYRAMTVAGLSGTVLATAVLLGAVLQDGPTWLVLVCFAVFQGSLGFVFGNATTMALEESGRNAGTGSAFLGFLQFALAAAVSPLVGLAGEDTAVPMAVAMFVSAVLAAVALAVLPRRPAASSTADHEVLTAVG